MIRVFVLTNSGEHYHRDDYALLALKHHRPYICDRTHESLAQPYLPMNWIAGYP